MIGGQQPPTVSIEGVRFFFEPWQLRPAAARYRHEAVLLVRLYRPCSADSSVLKPVTCRHSHTDATGCRAFSVIVWPKQR